MDPNLGSISPIPYPLAIWWKKKKKKNNDWLVEDSRLDIYFEIGVDALGDK